MSVKVNDFKWEKGKNDYEYIALLESHLSNMQKQYRDLAKMAKEQYYKGRDDQKHEDLDAQVVLTKNEIKVLETSLIKKILTAIESQYDLDDEYSAHPREFYDLVEGFYPTVTPPIKDLTR